MNVIRRLKKKKGCAGFDTPDNLLALNSIIKCDISYNNCVILVMVNLLEINKWKSEVKDLKYSMAIIGKMADEIVQLGKQNSRPRMLDV